MKLTTKEIAYIAKEFDDITDISLFANINETLEGSEARSLVEKGIYKDGKLTEQAEEILEIVAKADNSSRLLLRDNFFIIEKYTYRVNEKMVLAENDGGEFSFSLINNFDALKDGLAQFVGNSLIKTTEIEVLLSADELMVLLALVDIYRHKALLAYTEQAVSSLISLGDITKQLNEPTANSLVQMLKKNYNFSGPEEKASKVILDKIAEKQCVSTTNGYALTDNYALFANNFLIPESIILIESFAINKDSEVLTSGVLFVSAGIKDIGLFIFGEDLIEFSTVSGGQMLQLVENFLRCPDLV